MSPAAKHGPRTSALSTPNWRFSLANHRRGDDGRRWAQRRSLASASSWNCWAGCCKETKTELLVGGSSMPKLVARCIAISLDGFSAAKGQTLDAPFGKDGLRLMGWAFA